MCSTRACSSMIYHIMCILVRYCHVMYALPFHSNICIHYYACPPLTIGMSNIAPHLPYMSHINKIV